MADPLKQPDPTKRRILLSTAENVAKIFDQDWCVIVGARKGDIHFVPWNNRPSPASETEMNLWLARLAEIRQSLLPKGS